MRLGMKRGSGCQRSCCTARNQPDLEVSEEESEGEPDVLAHKEDDLDDGLTAEEDIAEIKQNLKESLRKLHIAPSINAVIDLDPDDDEANDDP